MSVAPVTSAGEGLSPQRPRRSGSGRSVVGRLLGRLVVPAVLVGTAFGGWRLVQHYGGFFPGSQTTTRLTHVVGRGNLVVTVVESGTLESADNRDVRCLVIGGGTIKKIIPDGTHVKEGDELAEIDSAAIDEQILQQQILFEKARAVRDQAQNDLAAARISLREYVEGTYQKDRQSADAAVTVAEENLRSAENTAVFTERMFRKAYVTKLQLEAQQFAVKRAQLDLETAKTAKRVLEEFTFTKMKNDLETLVATAEAKSKSEQAAFELEESKLNRLKTQKANCKVSAPQDGMVVSANESSSSGRSSSDRPKIEEGAIVPESQVMFRLPDLSQMQVKVTVHESKVESLRPDMPASINIQRRRFTGYVTSVANQPEPLSFMSGNIKKYAALVRIDGEQHDLRPGMTAEVEILVDERKDVLTVPVQCLVEQAGKFYCWKVAGADVVKTEVQIGPGDDRSVEIRAGLAEKDEVLQNPPEKSEGSFTAPTNRKFGAGPRGSAGDGAATPDDRAKSEASTSDAAGGGGAGRGPRGGGSRPDFGSLDKNADGKIGRDEAPPQMQAFFGRLDADGDGFVTQQEWNAMPSRSPRPEPAGR